MVGGGILHQLVNGGGWFLQAIFIFYIAIYIIKKLFKRLEWPFVLFLIIGLISYFVLSRDIHVDLFSAESYHAWYVYFLVMLLGSMVGSQYKTDQSNQEKRKTWTSLMFVVLCLILYYGVLFLCRRFSKNHYEIISILPFFALMIASLQLCGTDVFEKIWNSNFGIVFRFISSHCWEIYLAQFFYVFTYHNKFDRVFTFPLNIPMTFLAIFATAYCIKLISRLIVQLFNKEDFNWKEIVCTWN